MPRYSYLIAEDEPALATELAMLLRRHWPEAICIGVAASGDEALHLARREQPDIVFLDVRMPGCDGITVARELCKEAHVPLMVFVTAFDQYALAAFDAAALDYLLKPVECERLALCVERLKERLARDQKPALDDLLCQLRQLVPGTQRAQQALRYIRAGTEQSVRLIPVEEVLYFEARDKYVSVITPEGETLIRTALRDLLASLDPEHFWQVHRGLIVNAQAIVSADRDKMGRVRLNMRDNLHKLVVSRQFSHRFKPM
ncbi:LytTR family DNA-binding domain-containing protein [Uliginosibacterium sp. H3]|uniref:LytTR family DNA-binding domain-containing protein n=1 Tax=Uliginosibacterium silvisoli TaxID=3114758 RepID=A0ABU6K7V8_9RHOO|nr:LytTR family DNA-binding domain-containing protein [Uliginosibacterium sp. H3]